MQVRIVEFPAKTLIGMNLSMSLVNNRTPELWRGFMPRLSEIKNRIGEDLFSVQVNETLPDFKNFDPSIPFQKWAAVEVGENYQPPQGMEQLVLPAGLYAVFRYRGLPSQGGGFFRSIYTEWLPASGYVLDHRPQFEILGAKYKNEHPDSEEDICIPLRKP